MSGRFAATSQMISWRPPVRLSLRAGPTSACSRARCDREALRLKRMALGACDGWVSLFFPSIRGEVARSAEALERQRQKGGPSFAGVCKGWGFCFWHSFRRISIPTRQAAGSKLRTQKPHPLSAADKGWGTQNIPGASSVGHPANYLILVSANSLFLAATGQGQKQRPRRPA